MQIVTINKSKTNSNSFDRSKLELFLCDIDNVAEMDEYAIFQSNTYEKIFGKKKIKSNKEKKMLSVVKIRLGNKCIYRQFCSKSVNGYLSNYIALTSHSISQLNDDSYKLKVNIVEVTPGSKWFFYWQHPKLAVRISARFGIISIGLGVLAFIISVLGLLC